jgi:ABC-type sugar transport system ATPase subunit
MTDTAAVEAIGLQKSYSGKTVLDGIDVRVERGSVFALLGPNGAGKTTTVRILSTLTRADGGSARVAGYDVVEQRAMVRRSISLTGQYTAVDELQTGVENLRRLDPRLRGAPADHAGDRNHPGPAARPPGWRRALGGACLGRRHAGSRCLTGRRGLPPPHRIAADEMTTAQRPSAGESDRVSGRPVPFSSAQDAHRQEDAEVGRTTDTTSHEALRAMPRARAEKDDHYRFLSAEDQPAGCSAAIVVWEDSWAAALAEAVRSSDGLLARREVVPHEIVQAAVEALEASHA